MRRIACFECPGSLVVARRQRQDESARHVSERQLRRQLQRFPTAPFRSREIVFPAAEPLVERCVRGGQARPGRAVAGIELDRALEHVAARLQIGLCHAGKVLPAAKVVLVGGGAGLRTPLHRLLLTPAQDAAFQRRRDALGDLVLDREDVVQRAIEALRPPVVAAGHFDQLDRDAQPIVGLANASFEQRSDAEMAADLANVRAARRGTETTRSATRPGGRRCA